MAVQLLLVLEANVCNTNQNGSTEHLHEPKVIGVVLASDEVGCRWLSAVLQFSHQEVGKSCCVHSGPLECKNEQCNTDITPYSIGIQMTVMT
jgi:hypothetical protein